MDIVTAILAIGGTGLVCGLVLAAAARFFAVQEDPRVEAVAAMLPGVNCGGCSFAGCGEYAKAVVQQGADPSLCKPGGAETVSRISAFLGVQAAAREREVAIVLCGGSDREAARRAEYNGLADCAAAELAGGGFKACRYGCLGLGSCARVCPVGAIEITDGRLAVVHPELCIACGRCVSACPRRLIRLVPESRSIHVLCSSHDRGPVVRKVCSVGCIGCTLCVKAVGGKGIAMKDNLAVVDYGVALESDEAIAKCPAHTIVKRIGTATGVSA